jgi:hypothetical protein
MRLPYRLVLIGVAAGTLLVPALPARAQDQEQQSPQLQQLSQADDGDWRFSLQGAYLYGSVDGYVQTPSGGEPGTTSKHEPKLDQIGIDDVSLYDISGVAAYHREEFYGGAQIIQMSGSSTLHENLISQGLTFPAGTHVSSDVDLTWYRFGYRHRFSLGDDWTLWPSVGGVLWDFHYKLKGGGNTADRSYGKANVHFGLEVEWRPQRGRFAIDAAFSAAPPISSWPEIYTEQIVASYQVIHSDRTDLEVFGGVAFEQQYYEDNQAVSNRVEADFGPMLIAGLRWSF